jgi:hypothetical protein
MFYVTGDTHGNYDIYKLSTPSLNKNNISLTSNDLVQIITVFSCKLQGKRANKARKLVKELIEEGGEENDKNNPSDVSS